MEPQNEKLEGQARRVFFYIVQCLHRKQRHASYPFFWDRNDWKKSALSVVLERGWVSVRFVGARGRECSVVEIAEAGKSIAVEALLRGA